MSTNALQREGRDAYKRKDFTKALEFFNRAVGRGDPSLQLLDNLAATHDKLGDLPSALKSAKKTIQTARDDPTGYLRAGSVLKKMEKPSVALEIYAHGLKCIKHVGQGYEQLRKVHDELQGELSPRNSVDPLTMLPRELAVNILEYLNFRQRIAISRVSKGWMKFIRSEPNLWAHLDLSGARGRVRSSFVSRAINTARSKLVSATLNQLYDFDKVLHGLVNACPLESLTLANTGLHANSIVELLAKADKLRELKILSGTQLSAYIFSKIWATHLGNLEVLECSGDTHFAMSTMTTPTPSRLKSLHLDIDNIDKHKNGIQKVAEEALLLERLTLIERLSKPNRLTQPGLRFDLRPKANLHYFHLRLQTTSADLVELPPSIRTLRIKLGPHDGRAAKFFDDRPQFMARLPNLHECDLDLPALNLTAIHDQFATDLVSDGEKHLHLSKLTSLSIANSVGMANIWSAARLRELQHLALPYSLDVCDEHVEEAICELKQLRRLEVSGAPITGVVVKSAVMSGHVRELIVVDCLKLGRDAVDWARNQGVKVDYKISADSTSGKKVRY